MACRCAARLRRTGMGSGRVGFSAADDFSERNDHILDGVMVLLLMSLCIRVRRLFQKCADEYSLGPQRRYRDLRIGVPGQTTDGTAYGVWQVQSHTSGFD